MKLQIEIDLDNDAFVEPYAKFELNSILHSITDKVYYASTGQKKILDSNGNTVGYFKLTKN